METPPQTATAAGGMHPTGMHSCFRFNLTELGGACLTPDSLLISTVYGINVPSVYSHLLNYTRDIKCKTRMHSGRMRTARLGPIFGGGGGGDM